ncbi:MAG: endonuclease NucS [Candidatus Nanohaloarchaea archaeon]|nr:endonuclease NucS [Candidatus Nanohaloarchaea archaeon]
MERLLENPDIETAAAVLDQYLSRPYTVQINGLCSVSYQGRAKSSLDRGERLVIAKQDSALLVHGPDNYQPRNWQPEVDTWTVEIDEEELVVTAVRRDPDETVDIRFSGVDLLMVDKLVDESEMELRGHEIDIHDAIEQSPALVEEELTVVERERKTPAGYIDVFCRDRDDRYVVIEVKRNPDYNTVLQLQRYVDDLDDEFAADVRGILVAPKMTENVLDYLEDRGLEFVEIEMEDVIASHDGLDTSQQALGDFAPEA